ncbi:MAG: hypothetical protein ABGX16_14750 [Pirellulales bacterium]
MSETTNTTDWTALALQAMEQQHQIESATEQADVSETSSSFETLRIFGGIAQLLFWGVLGYFLVIHYGAFNLIWIALVIWFQVIPSMTLRKKSAYK